MKSSKRRVHKGGRPRKPKSTVDVGTPELVAKRAALTADATLSTCPLDLALAKGMIDRETHSAAGYFAACRALVFGSPHPKALDLLRTSGASVIPNASDAEARYRDACDGLLRRGPGVLIAIESFVVHELFPAWLLQRRASPDRDRVFEGFDALLDWYKGRGRRRAA